MALDVRAISNFSLGHRKLKHEVISLVDGPTISWSTDAGLYATVTLAGNRVLSNPTNAVSGYRITIVVVQDINWCKDFDF